MFQTLIKVARVFRNIFFLKEPSVHFTPIKLMGGRLFLLFILNLLVPYGYLARHRLLQMCKKEGNNSRLINMLESGFFHSALRVLSPEERSLINSTYTSLKNRKKLDESNSALFLSDGYKNLGKLVSMEDCDSVISYFKNEKGFIGQVPMQSDGNLYSYGEAEKLALQRGRYFSFSPGTSLKNPIIARLVENDLIKKTVRANLGDNAVISSLNTFIVFPGMATDHYVMKMHRDYDDFNFIAFFVYWTGATAENGATLFIPKTNTSSDSTLLQHKIFLEGSPGDVFALDSFGYHAGNNFIKSPRFVTWFRYGLENNLAAVQDGWPLSKVKQLISQV